MESNGSRLTLPDRPCQPGGILLVGINPTPVSVAAGHYYQGRLGKRLWGRLRGLEALNKGSGTWEDDEFVAAGNGLTDLVKRPTGAANQLSAEELATGRTALVANVRGWRPGLLLFAFRPPAEALLGKSIASGRGPDFEGVPTFLLSPPYAPRQVAAAIDVGLLAVIRDLRTQHGPPGADPHPLPRQDPDVTPAPPLVAQSAVGPTQRVTHADLRAGRIRVPARSSSDAKSVLPQQVGRVRIDLRGEEMVVQYNPRFGPDRERSGVLRVGTARLAGLVTAEEILQVTVNQDGVVCLD